MATSRSVLVVGGTSGIGLAAARHLAAGGDTVHVGSRDSARVAAVAETAPELIAHEVDGADPAAVAHFASGIAPIDALVVTISSSAGMGALADLAAMPGTSGIGAFNAAVESVVRPLAVELAPRRINAVSPGLVDTPWWGAMPDQARTDYFAAAEKGLPVRHVSSAAEIGAAVAFLANNASMTGAIVQADGGARLIQL